MTWLSLPPTLAENKAAFSDSSSAAVWLAGQPQANAPAMLAGLVTEIQAFNLYGIKARERFKTMEVLRKAAFAVSGECQRRYENKPLPLLSAERTQFEKVRQLWRACTVAYLRCLRASLDGDVSISRYGSRLAHRVLVCLRMEQMNCYVAGAELDGDFWTILHTVLTSAEQLGVVGEAIEDRLPGETNESTISGQYCMALMLHLARPFVLSRSQFAAVTRWLTRWRELSKILFEPETGSKSCCLALDLSLDQPLHDDQQAVSVGRWLSVTNVLRKIRQRLDSLAKGESPESLKLGTGLSPEVCIELLTVLADSLQHPQQTISGANADAPSIVVGAGLENIHRLLGGGGLAETVEPGSSFDSHLSQEQIAIFGHVVREKERGAVGQVETWWLMRRENDGLSLVRYSGSGSSRLSLRSLLALKEQDSPHYVLSTISSLYSRADGSLCVTANPLAGEPLPLVADVREKSTGKQSRHPAFLLPASGDAIPSSVILPAGLPARALAIRFLDARDQSLLSIRLDGMLERGSDSERWSLSGT